jgi:hypothetical protein
LNASSDAADGTPKVVMLIDASPRTLYPDATMNPSRLRD